MDVVDVILIVFITIDTLMKIRDWVITFLESKRETTDDTPVLLTRKDRDALRVFFATVHQEHDALLEWALRIALKTRILLHKIAPEELRKLDDDLLSQRPR